MRLSPGVVGFTFGVVVLGGSLFYPVEPRQSSSGAGVNQTVEWKTAAKAALSRGEGFPARVFSQGENACLVGADGVVQCYKLDR
jgi:hypothetical protein